MTEVVTTSAAIPQLNLLASRQQVFGVSAPAPQPEKPTAEANALQSVLAAADKAEPKSFSAELPARDPSAGNGSGPSRPRVEIRRFDVGRSPSEVVGTQDVLQRFDSNGDGRVDSLEGNKAVLVRQDVYTFAGLAAAPATSAIEQSAVTLTEAEAPVLARETGAAIAALASFAAPGVPEKFSASLVQDPGAKKFFAEAAAAEGTPSGVADAPKKYYGQGAEVIAGPVANGNNSGQPVKYADRAPAREQAVSEEGTGEVKYYDRVPRTESGENDGGAGTREKYSDKAQEIAAAYAALQGETPAEKPAVAIVTA